MRSTSKKPWGHVFVRLFLLPAVVAFGALAAHAQTSAVHPALIAKRKNPAAYNPVSVLSAMPESICGANDLQLVRAYNGTLGVSTTYVSRHKGPVGALASSSLAGEGPKYCSGTLVGTNLFLTASHCVGAGTVGHFVSFNYERVAGPGTALAPERFFRVSAIAEDNTTLDFALLRLEGDPGAAFHWTDIRETTAAVNELIASIQHPDGRPKEIEAGHISSLGTDYMFYDDLDTEPGSSGSGVLDANGRLVGVHTNGGCSPAGGGDNAGIRMTRALALSAALRNASRGTHWFSAMGWCNHSGAQLFLGDFNGDRRKDMLCHDGAGSKWVALANTSGQFTGTSWSAAMGWCNHAGARVLIGDVNGDGRDDMLCHDSAGNKWTALANSLGRFTGTSWSAAMNWCSHPGSQLFVGDFNGDRRDDMLCHDNAGNKWVSLANAAGQFIGTNWSAAMGWCNHAGARILIGDYNGDGRDDMLCHDGAGNKWTALANAAGQFPGTSWQAAMNWCSHAGSSLHVGDFNGDRRTDMLCHDTAGRKWTALANSLGQFTGTHWSAAMGWCNHSGSRLLIGAFNTDARADMLCHDSAGNKWISNARNDASF